MKRGTSNNFLRIIATLLVLTSLQSCDVCLCLLDLGLESLDDWYYNQQCYSGRGQTYKSSGGGLSYRQSYKQNYRYNYYPNRSKNKGIQEEEEEIQEERIKTKKEKCNVCNGTGLVEWAPEFYLNGNRCKICQKKKDLTHRHPIKCKNCDGEGVVKVPIDE